MDSNSLHDLVPKELGNRKSLVQTVINILCLWLAPTSSDRVAKKKKKPLLLTPLLGAVVTPPERRESSSDGLQIPPECFSYSAVTNRLIGAINLRETLPLEMGEKIKSLESGGI